MRRVQTNQSCMTPISLRQKSQAAGQQQDRDQAASREQSADRSRVNAAHRIEAVAKEMNPVGKRADPAIASFDQSQPQVAAVQAETRERARDASLCCNDESDAGMRELIVLGVV